MATKEKKTLYPLTFTPELREKVWGLETCLMGDTGLQDTAVAGGWMDENTLSELMDTYTERIVGDKVMSWYGRQFPLMAKVLDIRGRNSLQVHPDDEIASQRYDALGRKTFWYILEAGKDAQLWLGFRKDTDAGELYTACADGSVKKLLNTLTPRPGDAWLIAPGTVHAAQDVKILEISEASEMNFRLYDWGRKSEDRILMLEDAMDFIEYKKLPEEALKPLRVAKTPDQVGGDDKAPVMPGSASAKAGASAPVMPGSASAKAGASVPVMPGSDSAKAGASAPVMPGSDRASLAHWVDEEEMIIHCLPLSDTLHIYTDRFESFILYTCVSGEVAIKAPDQVGGDDKAPVMPGPASAKVGASLASAKAGASVPVMPGSDRAPLPTGAVTLTAGTCALIPADYPDFFLVPGRKDTVLLEAYIARTEPDDTYHGEEPE